MRDFSVSCIIAKFCEVDITFKMGKVGLIKCHPISQTPRTRWCWRRHFWGLRPRWGKAAPEQPLHALWPSSHTLSWFRHRRLHFCSSNAPPFRLLRAQVCVWDEKGNGVSRWQDRLVQPTNLWECSSRVGPESETRAGEKRGVCIQHLELLSSVSFYVSLDL